ncbi:MAG: peptidase C39 family protein [Planctomycetes bacterium]|nr:peptidase C39 family protein [Planctomycetota bacterium]
MRTISIAVWLLLVAGCGGPRPSAEDANDPNSTAGSPTLWDFRLPVDAPRDSELQDELNAIDRLLLADLSIDPDRRACGVLDLGRYRPTRPLRRPAASIRYAAIEPDRLVDGGSVPLIGVLLGYFEDHPDERLDPRTRSELESLVHHPSNELAADYTRRIGLERLAQIYRSSRYRLYEDGIGGLWSGQPDGTDAPSLPDPDGGRSPAMTVRQVLRYFLMLEQGALVSPRVSREMRAIFEAPDLELEDSGFVRGLRGRDVTLIRKNGDGDERHLDVARIAIPLPGGFEHVLLLAAAVEHPRGDEYLARLAAAIVDVLPHPPGPHPTLHRLVALEDLGLVDAPDAGQESSIFELAHPADRALVSWNAACPPDGGVAIDVRVGRRATASWSPFLEIGYSGSMPPARRPKSFDRAPGTRVEIDALRSERRFDRVQYRVRTNGPIRLDNLAVTVSDLSGRPHTVPAPESWSGARRAEPHRSRAVRIPVPYRSQRDESPELAPRICSPTSLSMVLAYYGVEVTTEAVARATRDPDFDLYGNWQRAIQAAFEFGVPGYLSAYASLDDLADLIEVGVPPIVSIRASTGELSGAPYEETEGHLLVVTGFDESGDVLVNDPAATDADSGRRAYRRDELAWQRSGGVTYVLRGPGTD